MTADARLAIPAVVGWVFVALAMGAPGALEWCGVASLIVAALAAVTAMVSPRGRSVLALVIVAAAVAGLLLSSAAILDSLRNPEPLREAAHGGRFVTLTVALGTDSSHDAEAPITVSISAASIGSRSIEGLDIPALLFGELPKGGVGTVVRVSGTLAHGDDGDRVRFLIFGRGQPHRVAEAPWYLSWATTLRAGFRAAVENLPGDGGDLLPGLAIGDRSRVGASLDSAMKQTSLSHLTAVSGANCAVLVSLVMLVGGASGLRRGVRIGVSLGVLAAFVALVTPGASVVRAAVMAAIVLVSLARGRPASGLPVLSLTVIVLLARDPWLSRDFGFALSVLATAGLLLLAAPVADYLARWIPAPLALAIAIPVSAQLACQPVLIVLNPSIPVFGVLANILAEPAAPVATVLGLLGCVLLPVAEPIARVVVSVAWVPSAWIAAIARFFSDAPGAQAPWLTGLPGVVSVAVVISIMIAVILRPRSRSSTLLSGILVVSFVAYLGIAVGVSIGRRDSIPRDWQIAACDVGQGDAVLVRSGGAVALIDTGPRPERLSRCLDELDIDRLQLLVLSHYDLDHVGGLSAVLGRVDVALVGPTPDDAAAALVSSLEEGGAVVTHAHRGNTGELGDVRWEVLWPPGRPGVVEAGNGASVTVRFEGAGACRGGCLSSLFLGDLGAESQCRMLGVAHPKPVAVVKVAHHGSADQCDRLYASLGARVGLISVGADNTYGHPTDRILSLLTSEGTTIARTDLEGLVLVSPAKDGGVSVWTERAPERDVGEH